MRCSEQEKKGSTIGFGFTLEDLSLLFILFLYSSSKEISLNCLLSHRLAKPEFISCKMLMFSHKDGSLSDTIKIQYRDENGEILNCRTADLVFQLEQPQKCECIYKTEVDAEAFLFVCCNNNMV